MISCYRDAHGFPRVTCNDIHPLIAGYLEQDVQDSVEACQEILEVLDEIISHKRIEWSGTGNAHTLEVNCEGVVVSNEWDDSFGVAHIPLKVFRDCVELWMQFSRG